MTRYRRRYGAMSVDNALRLNPAGSPELLDWRDALDPQYARLWMDFTYGVLYARGVLPERTST